MATKQSSRKSSSRKSTGRSGRSTSGGSGTSSSARKSTSTSRDGTRGGSGGARKAASGGRGSASRKVSGGGASRGSKSASGSASRGGRRGADGALAILKRDHDNVDAMFKKYDRMKDGDERKAPLREQVCMELTVHAKIEEELFYPALKSLFEQGGMDKAVDLIEEADVEHASLKWLIEQLQSGDQSDEGMVDARVKVLSEYVKHHVQEEEGEIFKAARKVDIDLEALGAEIEARKGELTGASEAQREVGSGSGGRSRSGGRGGSSRSSEERSETETER
jgi:hemerythrin superfamily protein